MIKTMIVRIYYLKGKKEDRNKEEKMNRNILFMRINSIYGAKEV